MTLFRIKDSRAHPPCIFFVCVRACVLACLHVCVCMCSLKISTYECEVPGSLCSGRQRFAADRCLRCRHRATWDSGCLSHCGTTPSLLHALSVCMASCSRLHHLPQSVPQRWGLFAAVQQGHDVDLCIDCSRYGTSSVLSSTVHKYMSIWLISLLYCRIHLASPLVLYFWLSL